MADLTDRFQHALSMDEFNLQDCLAAIKGKKIPSALRDATSRLCVIRGIRYHPGFATDLHGSRAEFTRALNARSIVSDTVPNMSSPDEFPYCIWHPEVAAEATYRELARRYPQMKYHVGRACAVAGYNGLFHDLDILPEIHIAEEARDNGSTAIFNAIMESPVKYNVMNDYSRSIDQAPSPGRLNCDTAVRSSLERKGRVDSPYFGTLYSNFNITEDQNIDGKESDPYPRNSGDTLKLLYTPLPEDLPAIDKDLLIVMAAYYGDVDRYARLRRPHQVETEGNCVVRGIYHNTLFAKWLSLELAPWERKEEEEIAQILRDNAADDESDASDASDASDIYDEPWYMLNGEIQRSVTARFIMVNDLSRITPEMNLHLLPYTIWDPIWPCEETIRELVHRKPEMKLPAARACIVADYQSLFDELDPAPHEDLVQQAELSTNPHYRTELEKKAEAVSQSFREEEHFHWNRGLGFRGWQRSTYPKPMQWGSLNICCDLGAESVIVDDSGQYEGLTADPSTIELNVCVPDELKDDPPGYLRRPAR